MPPCWSGDEKHALTVDRIMKKSGTVMLDFVLVVQYSMLPLY